MQLLGRSEFSATKEKDVVKATVKDKGKGKRSFGAFKQQALQQRGPVAPRFSGSCHNCGKKGHKSSMCRLPRPEPGGPGYYTRPPKHVHARRQYSDFFPGSRGPDRQGQQQQQGSFQPQPSSQAPRWVLVHVEEPPSP